MKANITVRKHHAYAMRRWAAVVPILLFEGNAFAGCAPAAPVTVTVPAISYTGSADSVRPGDPIDSGWSPVAETFSLFDLSSCKGSHSRVLSGAEFVARATYPDDLNPVAIYPTGVAGIGYVMQMKHPENVYWWYMDSPATQIFHSYGVQDRLGMSVRLRFVATGGLQLGTHVIPAQTLATVYAFAYHGSPSLAGPLTAPATIQLAGTTITVNAASCRMTTPANQSVALPTVGQAALAAAGSRSGRGATFHIGMNCDANVALHVTMTDASSPTNTSNTLSLETSSTASGVGVQVFHDGSSTPLSYGPDSSVAGNTNQWKIGQSTTATSYDIPFTASYVRTGAVKPGSVQAKATFTFSYQ